MCQIIDTSEIKLVVTDIDGTIADKKGIANTVKTFFSTTPHMVTVASGRMFEGIHKSIRALCTAPVITEGGGRIVNERGETIQAWPLDSKTIEDFGRRVRDREIQLDCASYAIKGRLPYVFFIGEGYTLPTKYGGATIFTELDRFLEHGLKSGVCKINFRTRGSEAAAARDSRPSWPGVLWNEASADLTIGDKGTALTWLSTYLDIPLSKTLVAGNDENDTPMFALPDTIKICVGDLLTTVKMQELGIHVRVQDPNALGHTLQNLFR